MKIIKVKNLKRKLHNNDNLVKISVYSEIFDPKEVPPTQGKMGRQTCRVLLSLSYVPQKRQ